MNILNKFTIKNLKLNKKRTIVTIIGIMLSTALICGVVGLVASFQKTLINMVKKEEGYYHTTFNNVSKDKLKYVEENNKVDSYFLTSKIGWAYLEGSKNEDKPYISVLGYDKKALENYGVQLLEGRLPENSDEIVISDHIKTNGRVVLKVGDTITLNIGKRQSSEGEFLKELDPYMKNVVKEDGKTVTEDIVNTYSKEYKIVGVIDRLSYNKEGFNSPGYSVITYLDEIKENANISVIYKEPGEYVENNKNIQEVIDNDSIDLNEELLRYEGALSDNTLKVIYRIAGVVMIIIVVSSVFVIRNSFSISVSEKNKQYGMMGSVGATSKQIRKTVLLEGFMIGIIAIPLGIVLGIVAIIILLEIVNYLMADMLNELKFVYSIPSLAILVSIVMSSITIYLSCLIPARRASKTSPIESIRGNNDIKIKSKKIKTNKLIKKIFGIGGVIASKNLKRSRKKYRTTVISIVISIVIFISLSTFIQCGNKTSELYYTKMNFNVMIDAENEDVYKQIAKLENVDNYAYYYETGATIDVEKYGTEFGKNITEDLDGRCISVMIYNNEYFKQYIKELGLKEEEYNKDAVLIDEIVEIREDSTKSFEKIYNLKDGDKAQLTIDEKEVNVAIAKNTNIRPMGLEGTYYSSGMLIISQDFAKENNIKLDILEELFVNSKNTSELENTVNDLIKENENFADVQILNYDTLVAQQNRMVLVISIFLYGFITVISLIGVTNIFNTITTNMILRSKEFAMLKSIGMTTKEFNKMIRLESILYGLKSLLIGIPIGILGSYAIYKSFTESVDVGFSLPWTSIVISILFVFIIVGLTMRYSLNKINKQNIIETIRKDNI